MTIILIFRVNGKRGGVRNIFVQRERYYVFGKKPKILKQNIVLKMVHSMRTQGFALEVAQHRQNHLVSNNHKIHWVCLVLTIPG